ncbi:hypothetical protein AVEN_119695-1 [Araneus ventricosus]|uniref:Uncharacterized protein n=1 Tax=Araneus ventricosus TaxID=182803 RepID=A0A4Y2J045_ARAVE|nr:hypothetical protein AVEN_119695-1 [Araneus ventricosus]
MILDTPDTMSTRHAYPADVWWDMRVRNLILPNISWIYMSGTHYIWSVEDQTSSPWHAAKFEERALDLPSDHSSKLRDPCQNSSRVVSKGT